MTDLPEVSSSKIHFKSVLYSYWKAIVNKKIASGHAIYLLRGCSKCFDQCARGRSYWKFLTLWSLHKNCYVDCPYTLGQINLWYLWKNTIHEWIFCSFNKDKIRGESIFEIVHCLFEGWADMHHTANLYRDLWGFYREIGVRGFHIYRVSLGMILPAIITVVLHKILRKH